MNALKSHLNPDGSALLTIENENLTVNAAQIDEIIAGLAGLRARMAPVVAMDPAFNGHVNVTLDPRYWVSHDALHNATLLRLRHPGHGWLAYLVPTNETARMRDLLDQQVAVQEAANSTPSTLN